MGWVTLFLSFQMIFGFVGKLPFSVKLWLIYCQSLIESVLLLAIRIMRNSSTHLQICLPVAEFKSQVM